MFFLVCEFLILFKLTKQMRLLYTLCVINSVLINVSFYRISCEFVILFKLTKHKCGYDNLYLQTELAIVH